MTDTKQQDRILLMGMMGVGKTSVGRALSRLTGWRYVDNDELVEIAMGVGAREIHERGGREAIREAESAALRKALEVEPPLVAGVAGGVVDVPADLDLLRATDAFIAWLNAPIEVLARRVAGSDRAWISEDPEAALRRLYAGREEKYAAAADVTVDTHQNDPTRCAELILTALKATAQQ